GPDAKTEKLVYELCARLIKSLNDGQPVRAMALSDEDRALMADLHLLTSKKVFYVANVAEKQLANAAGDPYVAALRKVAEREGAPVVVISAAAEAEISTLPASIKWCAPATTCSGSSATSPPARPRCAPGRSRRAPRRRRPRA